MVQRNSIPTPEEYYFQVKIKISSTHLELLEDNELIYCLTRFTNSAVCSGKI